MILSIFIYILLSILLLLLILTVMQLYSMYRTHQMTEIQYDVSPPKQWPTTSWPSSTPEEQGMDATELVQMVDYYLEKHRKNESIIIDSITIIRNEHIIADLYFNPLYQADTKHIINSCTKSIMGILMGIAIDRGFIEDGHVPILNFFQDRDLNKVDEQLASVTIHDLLTMRAGWHSQDSYLYRWAGLFKMQASDDWIQHILNLPFEAPPNTRFDYSNMASFLLSAIITKASGMDTLSFARKYLFTPLEITDISWDQSPQGIYMGFARMWLKPHDMAKIGLLFLQKGHWQGQQIVSPGWVEASISAHSFPQRYRYIYDEKNKKDFGASGASWIFSNLVRPFTDGYGYQWWLDEAGIFSAIGVGGQYIMVFPKERLIVVATSKLKGKDSFLPATLLKKFIIPAIKSKTPLPANESVYKQLSAYFTPPSLQEEMQPKLSIPPIAQEISGKTYALETSIDLNPWQYDNMTLQFELDADHAIFSYTQQKGEMIKFEVGLDNQYRITDGNDRAYAAIGAWTAPNTFTISYEMIGYSSKGKWILTFENDEIEVKEIGMTGEYKYRGKSKTKVNKYFV